jgi:hypothetical protein
MAKGDKQDAARAKAAYAKATVKSVARYPKALSAQKAWDKSSAKVRAAKTQKARETARVKAGEARDKSAKATSKFNKVNNQRLEMQATRKAGAANKMKAQGAKINSSATSGYNRRGKK